MESNSTGGGRSRLRGCLLVAVACAWATACGPPREFFDERASSDVATDTVSTADSNDDASASDTAGGPDVVEMDAVDDMAVDTVEPDVPASDTPTPVSVVVYAHTADQLYSVNPVTFAVTLIGTFRWPSDPYNHQMTDIAITADGSMWGVTFNGLYRISPTTAACNTVAGLTGSILFNALSFVPPAMAGMPERLVAATNDGGYYEIDRATGRSTRIGSFSGGAVSSGDIVSVTGAGTFVTVLVGGLFGTEYLARLNDVTGATTMVGPTGLTRTWGLGYWGGQLYGFTEGGEFVTFDVATGRSTRRASGGPTWWGAGVTTAAPLTHM